MLIETIKADRLQAMKAKDELRKNLLGTLYAAATKDTKAPGRCGGRQDDPVVREGRPRRRSGCSKARGLDTTTQRAERAILEAYLPRTLSEAELRREHRRDRRGSARAFAQGHGSGHGRPQGQAWRHARQPGGERAGEGGAELTIVRQLGTSAADDG